MTIAAPRVRRSPTRLAELAAVLGLVAATIGLAGCAAGSAPPPGTCQLLPAGEVNRTFGLDDARGTSSNGPGPSGLQLDGCTYRSANGGLDVLAFTADYPAGKDPRQALADGITEAVNGATGLSPAPAPSAAAGAVTTSFTGPQNSPCLAAAEPRARGTHVAGVCATPGLNPTKDQMAELLGALLAPAPRQPRDPRCVDGQVCVPVRMAPIPDTSNGRRALVEVSVGGGAPVPVMLDTGSQGLRVEPGVIGPAARPTTLRDQARGPGGAGIDSLGVQASVTIGTGQTSTTTASPILVGSITSAPTSQAWTAVGAHGVLGIGPTPVGVDSPLRSPLTQLPAPQSEGYSITLPNDGGNEGSLSLARPARSPNTLALPMIDTAASSGVGQTEVMLCWTVADSRSCGPTLLDTASPQNVVTSSVLPAAPHTGPTPAEQIITEGTPVTIATPTGTPVMAFLATLLPETRSLLYSPDTGTGTTPFIASIGLFTQGTIGVDIPAREVLLTPDQTP